MRQPRPFAGASRAIGFERSYAAAAAPPVPLAQVPHYHHAWFVVADGADFVHWEVGDAVAEWRDVPIDLHGDLGLAAWRAIRETPEKVEVHGELDTHEYFAVLVSLSAPESRLPSVVEALKGLVDGPLAGLQRADRLPDAVVARLLARRWARPIDEVPLLALISAQKPPAVFPRPPFNLNGLDPCDELCVAGIARAKAVAQVPSITGRVVRVKPR